MLASGGQDDPARLCGGFLPSFRPDRGQALRVPAGALVWRRLLSHAPARPEALRTSHCLPPPAGRPHGNSVGSLSASLCAESRSPVARRRMHPTATDPPRACRQAKDHPHLFRHLQSPNCNGDGINATGRTIRPTKPPRGMPTGQLPVHIFVAIHPLSDSKCPLSRSAAAVVHRRLHAPLDDRAELFVTHLAGYLAISRREPARSFAMRPRAGGVSSSAGNVFHNLSAFSHMCTPLRASCSQQLRDGRVNLA